jgi:hypothetical protein
MVISENGLCALCIQLRRPPCVAIDFGLIGVFAD